MHDAGFCWCKLSLISPPWSQEPNGNGAKKRKAGETDSDEDDTPLSKKVANAPKTAVKKEEDDDKPLSKRHPFLCVICTVWHSNLTLAYYSMW